MDMPNVTKDQSNHAIKAAVITGLCTLLVGAGTVYATYHSEVGKLRQEQDKVRQDQEKVRQDQEKLRQPDNFLGVYEWQWAGDGWLGYLNVKRDGSVHLEMKKWMTCKGIRTPMNYLQQQGEGKADVDDQGTHMVVSIPVRAAVIDSACKTRGLGNLVTLHGTLARKIAFAGTIAYQTENAAPIGDMVLVKDFTSGQH